MFVFIKLLSQQQRRKNLNDLETISKYVLNQEEQVLRHLRENEGIKNWEKIAQLLNKQLQTTSRTGRQCRQKYVNHTKFGQENISKNEWTSVQELTLKKLYIKSGSSWSTFLPYFPNKSEVSMKNWFYNKLHKFSRKLGDYQKIAFKESRTFVQYGNLMTILELNHSIKRWISENQWNNGGVNVVERNAMMMLKMVFGSEEQICGKELSNYVLETKKLNKKLRCLGIFKLKNKKGWKISAERMEYIFKEDSQKEEQIEGKEIVEELCSQLSSNVTKDFKVESIYTQESNFDIQSLSLEDFEPFFFSSQKHQQSKSLLSFLNFVDENNFQNSVHF